MNGSTHWVSPRFRARFWIGVCLGLPALGTGGCDQGTGIQKQRPSDERSIPVQPPDVSVPEVLTYSPMRTGASLPSAGEVGPKAGTVRSGVPSAAAARKSQAGGRSPYGCYLASRPYTEEVRFRSIYLYFPDQVVKAAGDETQRVRYSLTAAGEQAVNRALTGGGGWTFPGTVDVGIAKPGMAKTAKMKKERLLEAGLQMFIDLATGTVKYVLFSRIPRSVYGSS